MPNVISLSGPNSTQQIVSQFIDQYNQNHRANQQEALGRDELAQRTSAQADTAAYQQGTLKDAQDKFALVKQQYNDQNLQAQAKQYIDRMASYHDAIQSMQPNDPQRSALEAQAKSEMASAPPELQPYIKIATLEPILTPKRQEDIATQGVMTGAAQGMQSGAPTPMQADTFSKQNFKKDLSPEMVKDTQARQPEAAPAAKGQTASPVTYYYRGPALGIDTTAEQDQKSQTAITQTGMQGQTQRAVAGINAKSAMDIAKFKETADLANVGDRDVRTSAVTGQKYAAIGGYTGKDQNNLRKQYEGQGIPALDKNQEGELHDADTAMLNMKGIMSAIKDKLPVDASGRAIGGPENKLSQLFQTDSDLAAFNAYRAAAIRNVRAMAGAKGLRINSAEIELAVQNDIPNITDTVGAAEQKTRNVEMMLSNAVTPLLARGTATKDNSNPLGLTPPGQR